MHLRLFLTKTAKAISGRLRVMFENHLVIFGNRRDNFGNLGGPRESSEVFSNFTQFNKNSVSNSFLARTG